MNTWSCWLHSRVQLAGEIGGATGLALPLTGPRRDPRSLPASQEVIEASHTDRQSTLLCAPRSRSSIPAWTVDAGQLGGSGARLYETGRGEPASAARISPRCGHDPSGLASVSRPSRRGRRRAARRGRAGGDHRAAAGRQVPVAEECADPDPLRHPRPRRHVLGRATSRSRARDRHLPPGLDAGHHPPALVAGQDRARGPYEPRDRRGAQPHGRRGSMPPSKQSP